MIPFSQIPRIEFGVDFFRQITVLDTVIEVIDQKLSDFREPLEAALKYVVLPSVEKNFALQGRPPWPPLSPETKPSPRILFKTGTLAEEATNAANWTVTRDMLGLFNLTAVVPYAGYHQMGAPRANIPARPYVEYQTEDIEEITTIFEFWVQHIIDTYWGMGDLDIG